ncbi:MAG: hypothetical protein ABI574_10865 [Burkholderiales bacterium]
MSKLKPLVGGSSRVDERIAIARRIIDAVDMLEDVQDIRDFTGLLAFNA